jgi:hypothetical protein
LVRPKPRLPIIVTWYGPRGTAGSAGKPNETLVDASVTSGDGLPPGRWTAVLRVAGTVLGKTSVTLG